MKTAIKNLKERSVAYVSFTGNYMDNAQIFKDLFDKLTNWAKPKQLIGPDTVFLSAYQDDPNVTPPDELKLEICMSIPQDTEVEGEVKKKILPGGKYAVMGAELKGADEHGPAWNKVVAWIEENDLEIDTSRPNYEIYLNNPEEHPEKHHILDICMSVK